MLLNGQFLFYHGMPSLFDINHFSSIYHRTNIVILLSSFGKRKQTIQMRNDIGIDLDLWDKGLHIHDEVVEETRLQRENLILSPQNLLLVLLQFLRDIALRLGQRLLAHPFRRHLFLIRIAHLQIVAKHVVIAYLQRRDTRLLSLALLYLQQIALAVIRNAAQVVELVVHPTANHVALLYQLWRIVLYLTLYPVA